MGWKVLGIVSGIVAGGLMLAAACAPTAKPASEPTQPAQPTQKAGGTTDTKPGSATQTQGAGKASVGGIPLDASAKAGGVLRVAYQEEGPTFSPWEEAGGVAFQAGQPLSNMLIQPRTWGTLEDYRKGAFAEMHPDLAKSWEQSSDGLTLTFKLREGIKWSDGKPLTCADAKWSFDTIRTGQGLKRSPRATHWLAVQDVTCADDLTLVIKLKRPKPAILEVIGAPYNMILPKHIYENKTDVLREKPFQAGTGPFTLKEWVPGERYVFAKKADYWNKPLPYLDGIEVYMVKASAQGTALRSGRIDIGQIQGWEAGAAKTLAQECKNCQVVPDKVMPVSCDPCLMFNHQRPPWNKQEIKDALSLAIDRKKYLQVTLEGFGSLPTGGFYFPGSPWALPKERLNKIPGYNFDDPEGNKVKARELLSKAGFKPGELEIPFDVGVYSHSDVPSLTEDWTAVGFKVKPTLHEVGKTYEMMGEGNFNVMVHGFWFSGVDPDFVLYENFYTGSDRNYNKYSNPQVDKMIDEMSVTTNVDERRKKAWDVAEILMKDQAKTIVALRGYQPIVGGRLRGYMPGPGNLMGYGPWLRYEHYWVSEK